MSGFKKATVSISQEEYDRLREAEGKLRSLPDTYPDTQQKIQEQSLELLQVNLREFQKREQDYQILLHSMDSSIQELEISTSQRLREYQDYTAGQVEQYVGCLWNYYDQVLTDLTSRYDGSIMELHQQQTRDMQEISSRFEKISDDLQSKKLIAQTWLQTIDDFTEFIFAQYPVEFFFPGRMQNVGKQNAQARQNLQLGLYEASISVSQQTFFSLSELRLELEKKQNEWQLLYQSLWEATNQISAVIDNSRFVPAYDLDGVQLDYFIDVNYWLPGAIDALQDKIDEMVSQLVDMDNLPASETLTFWLNDVLPGIYQQLEDVILEARVRTINSQLRINVADLVVQALEEQGFALSSSSYQQDDLRLGYGAHLANLAGNEVVIQVSPNGDQVGDNQLQIQSLDAEVKTEHELRRRWNEISQSLSRYGLNVGKYEQVGIATPKDNPVRVPHIVREHARR